MTAVKKERRLTRAQLEESIKNLKETQSRYWTERDEAKRDAKAAQEETEAVREKFADLKRRLHDSEVANARLSGYADRVHEDDIVRDGFVEIEDENGKRQVPKRPSQNRMYMQPNDVHIGRDFYNQSTGRTERRTHWTRY